MESVAYDKYITGQAKDWVELAGEDNAQRELDAARCRTASPRFSPATPSSFPLICFLHRLRHSAAKANSHLWTAAAAGPPGG